MIKVQTMVWTKLHAFRTFSTSDPVKFDRSTLARTPKTIVFDTPTSLAVPLLIPQDLRSPQDISEFWSVFHCCKYSTTIAGLAVSSNFKHIQRPARLCDSLVQLNKVDGWQKCPFQTQLRESKWITICVKGQETLVTFNDGATGDIVNIWGILRKSQEQWWKKHFPPLKTTKNSACIK